MYFSENGRRKFSWHEKILINCLLTKRETQFISEEIIHILGVGFTEGSCFWRVVTTVASQCIL